MNCTPSAVLGLIVLNLACFAQQPPDPIVTLQHAEQRVLADLDRMPRYTCVQTITRTYYDVRSVSHGSSCSAFLAARARKHNLSAFGRDRLRIEVAWIEGKNLYSWVGEPAFANDNLEILAGDGPLGSGDFGVVLREILLRSPIEFQREQVLDGKRVLEYSYDMPLEQSTYSVKTTHGWARVAYSGTLLFDSEGSDLARLTMRIAKLPLSSSTCRVSNEVTYERIPIHDRLVLIPRETRLDIINTSGTESLSQMAFANCREYKSTSRLLPDTSTIPSALLRIKPAAPSPTPLPVGLEFDARIITPIDSDTAAAGDPIEAVLRSPIRGKNKAVLAPPGSRIYGRLTEVQWRSKPVRKYEVTVRFESIEIAGRRVAFRAVLALPHTQVLTGTFSTSRLIPLKTDDPSLGSTFSFSQEHFRAKNLDARWVTVSPKPSIKEK